MLWLPLVGLSPLHVPEAVQDVALVELHVSVAVAPLSTAVGFAASIAVAAGITVTAAVTTLLAPPAPVQVNEYAVLAARAPVLWLPLVGLAPLQPPEALQAVASVELQVSREAPPVAMVSGAALSDAVGCNEGPGESEPPPHAASNIDTAMGVAQIRTPLKVSISCKAHALFRRSASIRSGNIPRERIVLTAP